MLHLVTWAVRIPPYYFVTLSAHKILAAPVPGKHAVAICGALTKPREQGRTKIG